ncbi:Endonuclease/Exonuclease/phosphatase family protein [Phycisphaerae bacterium RAS1]|nr:Endonuclease/Exonuclease/phosphatase family protein [Phycisphaerae bacterium RAS1]
MFSHRPASRFLSSILCATFVVWLTPGAIAGEPIDVVGFNCESGDADSVTLAGRIAAENGIDIWGLCEVLDATWADAFKTAAADGENAAFASIVGTTGGADRMVILYNSARFQEVRHFELHNINIGGNVRAPLVAELVEPATGVQFFFMVNHLYRSKPQSRHEQARLLNQWARLQTQPIIAVGDYNFDWEVEGGEVDHDKGYDELTKDGVFAWVRPAALEKTQCAEQYNSVLDFVFVTGQAQTWAAVSTILPGNCPDDNLHSDHKPVKATFGPADGGPPPTNLKQQILDKIQSLEQQLQALRQLVQQL